MKLEKINKNNYFYIRIACESNGLTIEFYFEAKDKKLP